MSLRFSKHMMSNSRGVMTRVNPSLEDYIWKQGKVWSLVYNLEMQKFDHKCQKILCIINRPRAVATYSVPANVVLRYAWSSGKNLANPKSPILGWNLSSRRMLLALISLWTILKFESSCRYCNPRAMPRMIWNRVFQLRKTAWFPVPFNY